MKVSTQDVRPEMGSEDITVRTSDGLRIPAHSSVLASASPVFDCLIERRRRRGRLHKGVPVLGVPSDAVTAFIELLYSPRCATLEQSETMDRYGMHLMVLAHAYRVKWLKDLCERELALRLTLDSVVDQLLLARQCDVPRLHLQCMRLLHKEFAAVERTEAWMFLQENDPWLELDILKFLEEEDSRRKRRRRKMEEQRSYSQLSEAMECLQHIFTEGCTHVGPQKRRVNKEKGTSSCCPNHTTCHVLQSLIKHLASCQSSRSACPQCRRIRDLLRLHAASCQQTDRCEVPLCKQFKLRMQMEGRGDNGRWRVLGRKVSAVKVMSSLAKRRLQDVQVKFL